MTSRLNAIVVGIGSEHGDDRVGWMVTDRLQKRCPERVEFRKVTTPIDLIEVLDEADEIHVVDAATDMKTAVLRLRYAVGEHRELIAELPPAGTHGFGLDRALRLAESLDRRTDHVHVWLVSGSQFLPFTSVSERAGRAGDECARQLSAALDPDATR